DLFVKQNDRQEKNRLRRGYKTGYQVFHEFAVTQGESSLQSLKILKDFFKVGSLYKNRRYDNHKEDLYRYVVRRREDLIKVIIPFFDRHTLQTSKKDNLILFARCLEEIAKAEHLKREGRR